MHPRFSIPATTPPLCALPSDSPIHFMAVSINREQLLPLRPPAYTFFAVTILFQFADFVMSSAPLRPASLLWRFSVLGSFSNIVGNVLLLLLLTLGLALATADHKTLLVVAIASAAGAIVLFIGAGAFVLDGVQVRAQVDHPGVPRFDLATGEALVKFLIEGAIAAFFAITAIRAWRAAIHDVRRTERVERPTDDILISRSAGPRAP